ncbi:MAG: hypothetical protein M3O33_12560 [Cyanobacteriota bacterium]|nr:hypothetical protein [Cyanobacteriota bacterium]
MLLDNSDKLVAIEDLLIAVQFSNESEVELVQGEALIDLSEFNLTPQEVQKFQQILRKLNSELAKSLQKAHPATSVISEIRFQSSNTITSSLNSLQ